MKNFFRVTTPSGFVYEIPTMVVADHRAAAMLAAHPDEFADINAAMEDTIGMFSDDDYNIKDWASNNMNWEDLQSTAKLVRYKPSDEPWFNGEFSYHDEPALMGELDGATLMKQPTELVMNSMAMNGRLCNATVLHGIGGEPYGAFVMIIGNQHVINSYLTALQFVGDQITGQQAAEQPVTH